MKTDKTTTSVPKKHAGGRPPKFREPRRPITVTLPDRALQRLTLLDADRAKAIVKAVEVAVGERRENPSVVEVVSVAPGIGILIAPPSHSLRRIPWLRMIEVAPARFLLTITSGTPIEKVEVALADLIDDARETLPHEMPMLIALQSLLKRFRKSAQITKAEMLFVAIP